MYIHRNIEEKIIELLKYFPAIAILGSRQVGKTTLVKMLQNEFSRETIWLDLENPTDMGALVNPIEFFNGLRDKTVIIDEVQRKPDLFPVLRSAIDTQRDPGRFILLGSASPELLLMSNESLAGRIIYTELSPFTLTEINDQHDFRIHWIRGGYPIPFLMKQGHLRREWFKSFVSAYVERDLRMLGLSTSPAEIFRLMLMLSQMQGQLINVSNLAKSLGISSPATRNVISFFERSYILRLLTPFHTNIGKRLVKAPKCYFRDSGFVNHLLGIYEYPDMLKNPILGHLWEGYVIENVINILGDDYQFHFYRTADGAECDLLIFKADKCLAAIDVKFAPVPKTTRSMTVSINDLQPGKAYYIIPDCPAPYELNDKIRVLTLEQFILQWRQKFPVSGSLGQ